MSSGPSTSLATAPDEEEYVLSCPYLPALFLLISLQYLLIQRSGCIISSFLWLPFHCYPRSDAEPQFLTLFSESLKPLCSLALKRKQLKPLGTQRVQLSKHWPYHLLGRYPRLWTRSTRQQVSLPTALGQRVRIDCCLGSFHWASPFWQIFFSTWRGHHRQTSMPTPLLLLEKEANHRFSIFKDLDKQPGIEPTSINSHHQPKAPKTAKDAVSETSNTGPAYVLSLFHLLILYV